MKNAAGNIILILLLIVSNILSANEADMLQEIRTVFSQAIDDMESTMRLGELVGEHFGKDVNNLPPLGLAYFAMYRGLLGKHETAPFKKLGLVNESIELIDRAVARDSGSFEIRFLRFSFYEQLPGFFAKSSVARSDAEKLLAQLEQPAALGLEAWVIRDMVEHLAESSKLNREQKAFLKTFLDEKRYL
jgi:hypothetical protein